MNDEIRQFISEFEAALETARLAQAAANRAKLARRPAHRLSSALLDASEFDPVFTDLARRAGGIESKLVQMIERKSDLSPYLKKAKAILALDDMIPAEAVAQVRALLEKATKSGKPPGRQAVALPFGLRAECQDCQEIVVGERKGSPRWGHVRGLITRHDQESHEGFTPQERLDLRAASTRFEDGEEEVTVKRYRIFRAEDI